MRHFFYDAPSSLNYSANLVRQGLHQAISDALFH